MLLKGSGHLTNVIEQRNVRFKSSLKSSRRRTLAPQAEVGEGTPATFCAQGSVSVVLFEEGIDLQNLCTIPGQDTNSISSLPRGCVHHLQDTNTG
jgi:hypothetical protein